MVSDGVADEAAGCDAMLLWPRDFTIIT